MNRTPTLHLKRITITVHKFSITYTLWSLLFSIFSNWAHTKVFCGQSFEPLHLLDLDNLISTLKVLSLLSCNACVNSAFSAFVFIFNLYIILFEWLESRGKGGTENLFIEFLCFSIILWVGSPFVISSHHRRRSVLRPLAVRFLDSVRCGASVDRRPQPLSHRLIPTTTIIF